MSVSALQRPLSTTSTAAHTHVFDRHTHTYDVQTPCASESLRLSSVTLCQLSRHPRDPSEFLCGSIITDDDQLSSDGVLVSVDCGGAV